MDKDLFVELFSDECFKNFCTTINDLRYRGHKIETPIETAALLYDTKVNFVKGNKLIEIHNLVKEFFYPQRPISTSTLFYDYFVIKNIMQIADRNVERIEYNTYRFIPLDLTEYANSICKFNLCSCGYKPKIIFSNFIDCLTGKVICEKCGLLVSTLFIYNELRPHKPVNDIYRNLQDGINELADSWNKEVAKNESILHRTMRKLLSYESNVCVNKTMYNLHTKLYDYMINKDVYKNPRYWNESENWEIATDRMLECKEPVQWVEEYLWETQPCRIK